MNKDFTSDNLIYKNYISTHFGEAHKEYKKGFFMFYKYFKKNYLGYFPKNKEIKILDIGCGMGHFMYFLKKEGYRNYLGIDISKECIEFCKEKKFNVQHIDIFEFLKTNKAFFDIIVMNDIIEHLNRKEIIEILELIHNNLNENGKIFIKTPNMANPILGVHGRYIDFSHKIGFTEESLAQVLRISNFKNIEIIPQDIYVFYCNPLNYLAKFTSKIFNLLFRLLFLLYGRKTTRIFTKTIIAIANK